MKKISLIFCTLIFVSGCNLMPASSDNISENDVIQIDIEAERKKDSDYYMQIAKDLYVAKQYEQALKITEKLAQQNNPEAQYLLGYLIYYGQGVIADKELGTQWIQSSADAGYRPAIEGLVMIRHGLTPDNKCDTGFKIEAQQNTSESQVKDNQKDQKKIE